MLKEAVLSLFTVHSIFLLYFCHYFPLWLLTILLAVLEKSVNQMVFYKARLSRNVVDTFVFFVRT